MLDSQARVHHGGLPSCWSCLARFETGVVSIWIRSSVGAALSFVVAAVWFRRRTWVEGVVDQDDRPTGESVDLDATTGDGATLGERPVDTDD